MKIKNIKKNKTKQEEHDNYKERIHEQSPVRETDPRPERQIEINKREILE